MKLWMKLTTISVAVTMTVLIICLLIFTKSESEYLKHAEEDNARKSLALFCMNITSAINTDTNRIQEITLRSLVDYYFSSYAHLLQGNGTYYSLTYSNKYLFNTCPYKPMETYLKENKKITLLRDNDQDDEITFISITTKDGPVLIGGASIAISDQTFDIFICKDISNTKSRINHMYYISMFVLIFVCLVVAGLTAFFMHYTVQPIVKLTNAATLIAGGEYHQRITGKTSDEIGELSEVFNCMAESIEEKILSLDKELANKQLLVGALTHEWKTPMTAIIGYSDSLLHMPLNEEQQIESIQKIYNAGRHTEALSMKMLELISLSEQRYIEKKRFSADRFVKSFKDFLNIPLYVHCEVVTLYGDETLLLSLIKNLVQNSMKASPEKESITVDIQSDKDFFYLMVTDKGCGISKEHLNHITEPFYRVDRSRSRKSGGAGIGLALCKIIAEKHGGSLEIISKEGEGTKVIVKLLQFDDNMHTS